ncbi:MAG: hypothetical protein ACO3S0_10940 [bacterium]
MQSHVGRYVNGVHDLKLLPDACHRVDVSSRNRVDVERLAQHVPGVSVLDLPLGIVDKLADQGRVGRLISRRNSRFTQPDQHIIDEF